MNLKISEKETLLFSVIVNSIARFWALIIVCCFSISMLIPLNVNSKTLKEAKYADIIVTGTIRDATTGETMPGVSIKVKGQAKGTVTTSEGKFSLEVPENAVLEIIFLGYLKQEISVNGRSSINIILNVSNSELDEIVVIGYGSQRRSDLTGAISSVSSEQLNKIPTNQRIDQSLQGLAPGVNVTQTDAQPRGEC